MITEPRLEREWERAEERFRLLVESVKDYGIFMLDPEGYVVSWNSGAERIKGYRASDIIGSHFSRFYQPEDIAAQVPERELEIATRDGRVEAEGWRLRKDGTRFWADVVITALRDPVTNELRGFGKVTRDLTERQSSEERLRHSEEQFRMLVEGVREYAIFMLDPTGRVATWNIGAERAKGYQAEEIIGQSFERFYTAEDRANGKPMRLLAEAVRNGQVRERGIRVRQDGTLFHADVLITAIRDSLGSLRGFSKVTRDISDQIRTREMEAAKIAAEASSKAKDEFLAVLSHELRTPLTPVVAGLSYLVEEIDEISRGEMASLLGTMRRNVLLEAQIIDDLLDLTRISRGKIELRREVVDLHAALREVLPIFDEDARARRLELTHEFGAEAAWAWADPTRIRQVFWNLINNAVKFTPEGGRVLVRTSNTVAGEIEIEVIDNGIGIDPEQATRIFDAFEQGERTVTRRFGGLGLGLAITRNLVQIHGGSIGAESAGKGKGSTFRVTLATLSQPHAPGSEPEPSPPARADGPWHAGRPLHVLLVEDHEDTRRILSRLLTRRGYFVNVASGVESALAALAEGPFEVLVSDIGLPDGTGYELMKKARERHPSLRGIALSGFGMEEDVQRSRAAGFDAHLTKPVDLTTLGEQLAKLQSALAANRGE